MSYSIACGLLFSSLGDALLETDQFSAGIAAFSAAHLFYIATFGWKPFCGSVAAFLFALAVLRRLWLICIVSWYIQVICNYYSSLDTAAACRWTNDCCRLGHLHGASVNDELASGGQSEKCQFINLIMHNLRLLDKSYSLRTTVLNGQRLLAVFCLWSQTPWLRSIGFTRTCRAEV